MILNMKILFIIILLSPFMSHAVVDMKNSNFSDTWTDIKLVGTGYELAIERTYNSRSTFDGIFGFGWCSDFETKLEIMPDSTLKVTECGGGQEISYSTTNLLNGKDLDNYINKLVQLSKKRNRTLKAPYLKRLAKDLKTNQYLREALAKELGLKGRAKNGEVYFAIGRGSEKIILKDSIYKRLMIDGTYQKFNSIGQIISMYDRNGNYLQINYNGKNIANVTDNNGKRLEFKFSKNNKVSLIKGPENTQAKYKYNGQDLISVKNSWKNFYSYKYDDLHNLVSVSFPDGTKKTISYDKDKDLVTSFGDRNNCNETYVYQNSKDDPRNHYWSLVTKKCGTKVTNKSKYEFWHKLKSDGAGKFLYRVKSDNNGDITDVVYHDLYGRPIMVTKGALKTRYTYNKYGLVSSKADNDQKQEFTYDKVCKKLASVSTQSFGPRTKGKKLIKKSITKFGYEKPKCNLKTAINSVGQKIRLNYDRYGRINKLIDHTNKIVTLTYDQKIGKPLVVSRPGLGAIKVIYNDSGEIADVKSKQGAEVAAQVASIFNNLLEIISPATNELNI